MIRWNHSRRAASILVAFPETFPDHREIEHENFNAMHDVNARDVSLDATPPRELFQIEEKTAS